MPSPKPLVRFNNGEYIDQRQHDSTFQAIQPVLESEIVYGNLVTVEVVAGTNFIAHNLQRDYIMWIVAGTNSAAILPEEIEDNPNRRSVLLLNCAASGRLKLWIA